MDPLSPRTALRPGRSTAAWRAAHKPVEGVSRRARLIACAIPLTVLPSSLWRLPVAFRPGTGIGERAYILGLSALSEVLAFTAFGLIARWGEVFPRWVPYLRGRRVPVSAAVVPAGLGATALTLLWTALTFMTGVMGRTITGERLPADFPSRVGGWQALSLYVCYTPLLLWGPLLGTLTVAYARRRKCSDP
ncbi:hypothetical protein ACFV2N_01640 [Streptomyces sp. NPDC059680]|uniref:hypothetical protein n=1 Tax=Streptomyces TaxID=1883 RepID=UPI001E392968|nr:hypothetical protein [Streptomyces barringtoniae]MCC5474841.1 hypothetical protein [Streptomyces barringtoniae]